VAVRIDRLKDWLSARRQAAAVDMAAAEATSAVLDELAKFLDDEARQAHADTVRDMAAAGMLHGASTNGNGHAPARVPAQAPARAHTRSERLPRNVRLSRLLRHIIDNGPATRSELSKGLEWSVTTLENVMAGNNRCFRREADGAWDVTEHGRSVYIVERDKEPPAEPADEVPG
jgi:hypothetical protein